MTNNDTKKEKGLKIILLKPRGFCAGVDRALDTVDTALKLFSAPIYVKHEIVHNKFVVEQLAARGVIFVEKLSEVPDGAVVIFSAHGVPKSTRQEAVRRSLRIIDATCPLVTKVHSEVINLANHGCEIILIGHKGHVEVIGTLGQLADGSIKLISSVNDAMTVQINNPNKVGYVTQTTLSIEDTKEIISVLKSRFPNIQVPPKYDICYATQNRQNAVKTLIGKADILLIIGSKNSSNSNRLSEVSKAHNLPAYLIDSPEEILPSWLKNVKRVGLTAGASAPEDIVQDTIAYLANNYGAHLEELVTKEEKVKFSLPNEFKSMIEKK